MGKRLTKHFGLIWVICSILAIRWAMSYEAPSIIFEPENTDVVFEVFKSEEVLTDRYGIENYIPSDEVLVTKAVMTTTPYYFEFKRLVDGVDFSAIKADLEAHYGCTCFVAVTDPKNSEVVKELY